MALGENYTEDYRAERNPNRAVFGAYTSGSTGISKLVIHSSSNMVAVAFQMSIFIPPSPVQENGGYRFYHLHSSQLLYL